MWKAARSTHPAVWKRVVLTIKELNIDAYRYLIAIPPRYLYCTNTRFLYKYLIFVQIPDINIDAIIYAGSGPSLDLVVEPYATQLSII